MALASTSLPELGCEHNFAPVIFVETLSLVLWSLFVGLFLFLRKVFLSLATPSSTLAVVCPKGMFLWGVESGHCCCVGHW